VLVAASPIRAQIPDDFTNLKLLDPEIEKPELVATMREWALGLGVRCNHCHVGPDNLQGMDFASDDKATKRTARRMLEMSRRLNGEFLADLPIDEDGAPSQAVSCYTCHRGLSRPPRHLVSILEEVTRDSGPAAAIDEYRNLRAEHEISGRYDFEETSLTRLAQQLARAGDIDAAIALLQGAEEFFGNSPSLFANQGMLEWGRRNFEGARERYEKALAVDPEFAPARQALEKLDSMERHEAAESAGAGDSPDR
jgi:tetratricopeptide (TPR) repeat protein